MSATIPTFSEYVRERRQAAEMSQENLAMKAGIARSTLMRVEYNKHVPNAFAVARLVKVLNLDPGTVFAILDAQDPVGQTVKARKRAVAV